MSTKYNWDEIECGDGYAPMSPGIYPCQLINIDEKLTQFGDELWNLKWVVLEGEYKGRYIFDNLVFSKAALKRVKLVCARLGIHLRGEVELTKDMLLGKKVFVEINIEEYQDKKGIIREKNSVPFDGYQSVHVEKTKPAESAEDENEDLPF